MFKNREIVIRAAFVYCYLYLIIASIVGFLGVEIQNLALLVTNRVLAGVALVSIFGLLVMAISRLYRSNYRKSTKLLWGAVIFLTNFVGATAFYFFDSIGDNGARRPSK